MALTPVLPASPTPAQVQPALPAVAASDEPRSSSPIAPRVSIEIGTVQIRTAQQGPAAPVRRTRPPRAHAVDPRLRLRSGGW